MGSLLPSGAALSTAEGHPQPEPPSLTAVSLHRPQGLCFNSSAFILYLSAAVVDASSVSPERDSHNFNSWAASSVSEPSQPHPEDPPLLPRGCLGSKRKMRLFARDWLPGSKTSKVGRASVPGQDGEEGML